MKRRNWKHFVPRSPAEAMSGCAERAMERHNRGLERLATEHLGQHSAATLYKWMSNGRLPLTLVLPFERACGEPLITRYLAAAHGKLLVDMPTGRNASAEDMQELQAVLHTATGALLAFYSGTADAIATMGAIQAGLEGLTWHRGNVQQHAHPQLELGEHSNE